DSAPGREPQVVQARLEQAASVVAREGAPGLRLSWERRLGIGADVFEADRPLDRAAARRLMAVLAADPYLEYVEVDGLMRAYPQTGGPPREPWGRRLSLPPRSGWRPRSRVRCAGPRSARSWRCRRPVPATAPRRPRCRC